jgi:hypothetical protein
MALDKPNSLNILRLDGRAIRKKADGELQQWKRDQSPEK